MRRPTDREWTSIALLSIIVPVSLLTTFRLTGVLPEPPTPETITVETVTWNMSRPSDYIAIDRLVENSFNDDAISTRFEIYLSSYLEDSPVLGDNLLMRVTATANVSRGFIYSFVVKFSEVDTHAFLDIDETEVFIELYNLNVNRVTSRGISTRDAYFAAEGFNQPQQSKLEILAWWFFTDQNNINHNITVTLEATYYDGSTYRRIVLPINLGVQVA